MIITISNLIAHLFSKISTKTKDIYSTYLKSIKMIELDGSYLEGGGQILRTALALSTITQKPFHIYNIRKGRKNAGLKNQHLFCILALKELCNSKTIGAKVGSLELTFYPQKITKHKILIDMKTAGSITLFLQCILLPCLYAKKNVTIEVIGGTDVNWSPTIDYYKEIILPHFRNFAKDIQINVKKRGFFPSGNGKIIIKIKQKSDLMFNNTKIDLTNQGELIQIKGISASSKELLSRNVAERQKTAASQFLSELKCPLSIDSTICDTSSTGSVITLYAVFSIESEHLGYKNPIRIGSDELGDINKSAKIVGQNAAKKLIAEINSHAPVDKHLADNIIPLLALMPGSKIKVSEITNHTKTNIWVCEKFLGVKFNISSNMIESFKN